MKNKGFAFFFWREGGWGVRVQIRCILGDVQVVYYREYPPGVDILLLFFVDTFPRCG